MDCKRIELEKTNRFSSFFVDYLHQKEELQPFYGRFPEVENFGQQVRDRSSFPQENRQILHKALLEQYSETKTSDPVLENINLLKEENTYTITTGHQLNIFTGPLYFIYKIITIINACKKLKEAYPQYNFVPVYWMASEDHDFEEISYFRYNGKKIIWNTDQKGAVGKFDTSSIKKLFNEVPGLPDFFKQAYAKPTLSEAVRHYADHLFSDNGLVILDADSKELKKLFTNIISDDLLNNTAKSLVEKDSDALEKLGYKTQLFPREINFFYLQDHLRERIVEDKGRFVVQETDISFSKEETEKLIIEHPERFSPNVVMRPLYQEVILPNLAYVGGPAEVVYWLQLKSTFDHYKLPFPMLMPRNFAMVIPRNIHEKVEKAGLRTNHLFQPKEDLFRSVVTDNAEHNIRLNGQMDKFRELFSVIREQAEKIDPTLAPHVEAQKAKTQKRLEVIEKKFIRAEKRNQAERLKQIETIIDYLFPDGALQERTDNFMNFYLGNPAFINDLSDCFDPFDYRFHILNYGR